MLLKEQELTGGLTGSYRIFCDLTACDLAEDEDRISATVPPFLGGQPCPTWTRVSYFLLKYCENVSVR